MLALQTMLKMSRCCRVQNFEKRPSNSLQTQVFARMASVRALLAHQLGLCQMPASPCSSDVHKEGRGSSLSVLMGTKEYDLNFSAVHDLGNAVYRQWLNRIMTEAHCVRTFGDHSGVNDERAGDAVKTCVWPFSTSPRSTRMNFRAGETLMQEWSILFAHLLPSQVASKLPGLKEGH